MESLLAHLTQLSPSSVYLTLVGVLLLCGLGIPIPEDISLISAGYLAHLGVVNVHKIFAACFAAVLLGDLAAFALGYYGGRRILAWRVFQRFFTPRKQRRARAYFRKFGNRVIFVGRFLPGLRFSIFFSAGMLHVRPSAFLIYDSLAAVLSVPALVYMAYFFGDKIDHVVAWSRRSEYGLLVVVAAVVAFFLIKTWRVRRCRAAEETTRVPPPRPTQGPPGPPERQAL